MVAPQTPAPQPARGPGWLRGILARLRRGRPPGDMIAASVGDGNQGVAVGKNIVQIGTLVIPVIPVVAGLALLVAGAGAFVYFSLVPAQMTGLFNVAVAEFGQVDASGQVHHSPDGERLSKWIYDGLQDELRGLPPELQVQAWHDSMDWRQKRVKIGIIRGKTPEERTTDAASVAKAINARIVIYGNLAVSQQPTGFVPEFYVAQFSGEADEIVGRHQLGELIPIPLPIDWTDPVRVLSLNPDLKTRTKALTLFTVGLFYDLAGQSAKALAVFMQAIDQLNESDLEQGKEILYLFIGRTAFQLKRYDDALQAFTTALKINPDYARAHLGLGNVHYQQGQDLLMRIEPLTPAEGAELDRLLDLAADEYRTALTLAPTVPGSPVELKSHIMLGGTYRLQGDRLQRLGDFSAAEAAFDLAVVEYQTALRQAEPMTPANQAAAYLGLATTYHLQAHTHVARGDDTGSVALWQAAVEAYELCIATADAAAYDRVSLELKKDYCVPYRTIASQEWIKRGGTP